jgi:hypothetical protein
MRVRGYDVREEGNGERETARWNRNEEKKTKRMKKKEIRGKQ